MAMAKSGISKAVHFGDYLWFLSAMAQSTIDKTEDEKSCDAEGFK